MQGDIWEKEYKDPKLVTLSDVPAKCIRDFVRFLRKEEKKELTNLQILDLGCGNAKNSIYIAEQGENNHVTGIDISVTAIRYAKELAPNHHFSTLSIGKVLPYADAFFNIILDVTASNSLNGKEREIYLHEIQRTLKKGGYLFVRALCKDRDKNAQNLIATNPGPERDTYIMPELGLTERVFTREDLLAMYAPLGTQVYLEKETHYTKFGGQSYKRNFWVGVWGR